MASIPMVYIPGGVWSSDKGPVPLAPFWASRYLVTQDEFLALMGYNRSSNANDTRWVPGLPVENVNWFECALYLNQLSYLDGLRPAYWLDGEKSAYIIYGADGYRMPTVAEWDWIRNAGGAGKKYGWSDDEDECAWTSQNSGGLLHPVGTKHASHWGVYDIASPTWKWTQTVDGDHPNTNWSNIPAIPRRFSRGALLPGSTNGALFCRRR